MSRFILLLVFILSIAVTAYSQTIPSGIAQRDIYGEIVLSDDQSTLLFQSDLNDHFVLSDYGGYTVGDRVHVVGMILDNCTETHFGMPYLCFTVESIEMNECAELATSCCEGIRGNVDYSSDGEINIADIVYFVAYAFGSPSGPPPPCFEEADVNGDKNLDIADLVYLISYSFNTPSGPAPLDCLSTPLYGEYIYNFVDSTSGDTGLMHLYFLENGVLSGTITFHGFTDKALWGNYNNNSIYFEVFYAFDYEGYYSGSICNGQLSLYEKTAGWGIFYDHFIFNEI